MGFLQLIIFHALIFRIVDAAASRTDHCHFKNQTAAVCDTFSEVIMPGLSENIKFLSIHYSGPAAELSSEHLHRYKMLENLTLSGNLLRIGRLALQSQVKLTSLSIVGTSISNIPNDIFGTNATSLCELNLRHNKLSLIPLGLFRYLEELRVLNLADNCIKVKNCFTIGDNFKYLSKLSSLNIAGISSDGSCKLNGSSFLLSVNPKLSHLNISSTVVNDIYSDNVSSHFSQLKELDMSSARQRSAGCSTDAWIFFENLPKTLTKIYLQRWRSILKPLNRCFLNKEKLEGLRNLPELELVDMHFSDSIFGPTLNRTTFSNFTKLKTLDLGWCRIWDVEHLAFESCPQLQTIVLDGNPIGSKSMRLQSVWKNIKFLSMRHISATSDPSQTYLPALSLQLPPKLESIDASGNYLHAFPLLSIRINGTAQQLENACQRRINVTTTLHTPHLHTISLDYNYLTRFLPKHVSNRTNLCKNMSRLTTLSIQHNRLEKINGLCWSIKRLQLKWNFIGRHWKSNAIALQLLHRLEYLDLSYNTIWSLSENLFSQMNDLVEFYFAGNNITFLPKKIFSANRNLKVVDLSFNQLTNVDLDSVSSLYNLLVFDLRSNSITSFSKSLIDFLTLSSVKIFDVAGNDFDCGCESDHWYFRDWLNNESKTVFVPEHQQLKCRGQENQPFYAYTRDVFYCDWLIPIVATSSTILCIFLTTLIALPCYKYRWYIRHTRVVWRAFINMLRSVRFDQSCKYDAFVSYNTSSNSDTEFVVRCLRPALESKEDKVKHIPGFLKLIIF